MPAPSETREQSTVRKGTLPPIPEKVDLGSILLRNGVIQQHQLDECLRLQATMAGPGGGPAPRLGELLVQKGYASPEAIHRALREQAKKLLFCGHCNILINVDTRPDAIGYRCGRCEGELTEPPAGTQEKCVESSIIVNSRIPVPEEVRLARENTARRFGKYVILGEIGRGGIASVYRAWDLYLNQYVALKRIRPAPGASTVRETRVASLLNEAHNAIRLRHPNIVSIYDIGRIGNEYYISMEFLDGRTMFDEIRAAQQRGISPFQEDPKKWLGMLYQVAHALHYAHTRPIPTFHCDLKPGNVFITKDDVPYILDFGLARHVGEVETERGTVCGTPSYMSPEQASGRNDEIDARTDVYGLGAMLYELLTGQPPFTGDMGDVLRRTVSEMPPRPSRLRRRPVEPGQGTTHRLKLIPPELEELCMRCLEKEQSSRPQTALDFARAIEAIAAEGHGPLARPDTQSGLYMAVPPPPRRRVGFLTWALLTLGLMAFGAWVFWMTLPYLTRPFQAAEAVRQSNRHLADFRPELVLELDPDLYNRPEQEDLLHRVQSVAAFKHTLLAAIAEQKPVLPELAVDRRPLRNVKIMRGKPAVFVYLADDSADEAPWSALGPLGILDLARACRLTDQSPENRYGLALYCLSAGARGAARDLFATLDGTRFAASARKHLEELREK